MAALIGLASGAAAADLPLRGALPASPPPSPPVFTWTGFYVGAHAGYLWSDSDVTVAAVGTAVLPVDVANGTLPSKLSVEHKAGAGGVQAGYNLQSGIFVTGIEADISWTDADTTTSYSAVDRAFFVGALTNTVVRSELAWLGTLRARAGVAFDRALLYVTGGAAVGEVKNAFSVSIPAVGYFSPIWARGDTEWGWVVGAGIEYALTHNMSVKAEYLYFDLHDHTLRGTDGAAFPGEFIDYRFKNNGNIARAGLNLRF